MPAVSTFRELRALYLLGVRDFQGSDVLDLDPDNDLSGLCLDGIDLSNSILCATFNHASLRNAKFFESNIKTSEFIEADLTGADFRGAALCATSFTGAKMDGAVFEGAYFHSYALKAGEVPDW